MRAAPARWSCAVVGLVYGGHLPATGIQDGLVGPLSVPNVLAALAGHGGLTPHDRAIAHAVLALAAVGATAAVAWRRAWLPGAAGFVMLATVLTLGWTMPWYVWWVLPFAALARTRALAGACVVLTAWLALGAIPQMPKVIHAFGYYPTRTAAGLRQPPLHAALPAMSATVVPRPRVPSVVFQLVRFGLVGATNTALTLATYAVFVALGAPGGARGRRGWGVGARQRLPPQPRVDVPGAPRGAVPRRATPRSRCWARHSTPPCVASPSEHEHLPRLAGELAVLPPVTLLTFVLCRGWVFARAVPA